VVLRQQVLLDAAERTETGAAQVLFQRYNAPRDSVLVGGVHMPVPAAPTPQEAARVLVRYDGKPGTYTLGDAVQDLQDPARQHPDFQVTAMIEQWLKSMVLQRVATMEVARRHIVEEPALQRQAQGRTDNALLRAAYEALVVNTGTAPTADDLRAAYERHARDLVGPDGKTIPFEKITPQVQQALEFEAAEMRREQRLVAVTDSLRAVVKPVLYADRLKRIPWPVAPEQKKK